MPRRCRGRSLSSSLLHPVDPTASPAGSAALRQALVCEDKSASLAASPWSHICLARVNCCCILDLPLGGPSEAAKPFRHRTLPDRAFGPSRQNLRLGAWDEHLSLHSKTASLSLHPNVSAHWPHFRRAASRC